MKKTIEPGLLRIFRYFAGVAVVYFALLWGFTLFSAGWQKSVQFQFLGNFVVYFCLYGYLNLPIMEHRLKKLFLPLGLLVAAIFPVIGNFVYLIHPQQTDIFTIINRSWLWLPVLFVPLVLIAWQYNFKAVLVYIVFTNGLELIVLISVMENFTYETLPLISVPLIRAFAFGTVGYIVNILIETQRMQNQKLIQTNLRLNQYMNTLEQLATNRERNRLAAELHDTLAHTLSGLSINLEAIKTVVQPTQVEAQNMLDHSLNITRLGLNETRRVIKALRAGPLDDLGLKMALKNLAQATSARCSIPVSLNCPDQLPVLPMDVEQSVYRITQEGLENVVRHANASRAEVNVEVMADRLELTIHDDGVGFVPGQASNDEKFGLRGLQERAASIGGKLLVDSQPGSGTLVRFVWERFND
ncbi:MAG TPA: sensor histidine kinase [Anaerolineaceae bacterium]|nr:sensor histidine kinase [Anaerolineaceae bacterium]HRT92448.1 sensor histidine kinase [Anaerolineaceae bacterium]